MAEQEHTTIQRICQRHRQEGGGRSPQPLRISAQGRLRLGETRTGEGSPEFRQVAAAFFLFIVRQSPPAKSCTISNLLRVHLEIMPCFLYRMMVIHPDKEPKNGPALTPWDRMGQNEPKSLIRTVINGHFRKSHCC
jgi:hypothetical protein